MLLSEIYKFEHLETLLIRTLMYNSNENVRKSLERTFNVLCTLAIKKKDKVESFLADGNYSQMVVDE